MEDKEFIVIVQCHLVKQRCSGYSCEKAFHERTGGFSGYSPDRRYRMMNLTCGGCCGRPVHRKLADLTPSAEPVPIIAAVTKAAEREGAAAAASAPAEAAPAAAPAAQSSQFGGVRDRLTGVLSELRALRKLLDEPA